LKHPLRICTAGAGLLALVSTIDNWGLMFPSITAVGTSRHAVIESKPLRSAGPKYPGFAYDMWIDFEQDKLGSLVTARELAHSTHGASGSWDTSHARSHLTSAAAGEDPAHAITGDTGTRGLAYDLGLGGEGWVQWALPAAKHSLSFGLWYRTYRAPPWDEGPHFITLYNNSYGPMERFSDERSGFTNARQVRISPLDDSITGIADNTWYWFTMRWVQGSTGNAQVYDSNLKLIGAATFHDSINVPLQGILIGNSASANSRPGQTIYFDDLIVDYTSAAFPLLPKKIR
jgi:hypothetical protein